MRHRMKPALMPVVLVACFALLQTPLASERGPGGGPGSIDFRSAFVDREKIVSLADFSRRTLGTEIEGTCLVDEKSGRLDWFIDPTRTLAGPHVLPASQNRDYVHPITNAELLGACDSETECREAGEEACEQHGHGDRVKDVQIIEIQYNGSKTCSGKCDDGSGAWFIITCGPVS